MCVPALSNLPWTSLCSGGRSKLGAHKKHDQQAMNHLWHYSGALAKEPFYKQFLQQKESFTHTVLNKKDLLVKQLYSAMLLYTQSITNVYHIKGSQAFSLYNKTGLVKRQKFTYNVFGTSCRKVDIIIKLKSLKFNVLAFNILVSRVFASSTTILWECV